MKKLEELEKNPDAKNDQKKILMSEIETLQSLFENYNLGMNYFRRARGGRTGLRE
jgi:colicin import membrane protein